MTDPLSALDPQKRDTIINAALEEFATHRYAKASTNSIVNRAKISKGLLFHYFKNKETLYNYLKDFSLRHMLQTIQRDVNWQERDFFKRLKDTWIIKSIVLAKYPYLTPFFENAMKTVSVEELMQIIKQYNPSITEDVYKKNIDFTKFKDEIDIDKAIDIVQWTFEKIGEKWSNRFTEINDTFIDELTVEIDHYLVILRAGFYKEEYQHD